MNRRIRSIPFPMDHWKGIGWRKSPTLHANALTLEAYVTDRWTKNPINTVYFDNVVFARSYIGPASPKDGAGKPAAVGAGAIDREAILRELRDTGQAGMDRRLGPDWAACHGPGREEKIPEIWMPPSRKEEGGRRYQIGGPWTKEAGDFSSTQGQVLYVPDQGFGVDRVTVIEWLNGCFSERPEPPWWGGFRPEPASAKWIEAASGSLGSPVAMARGMGSWANCGVIVFSSGLIGTAVPRSSLREPTGGMSRPGARTGSRRGGSRISTGAWRSWTGRGRRDEDGQEGFARR